MPATQLAQNIGLKYIVPAKQIEIKTKQAKIPKTVLKTSPNIKTLELAMVGAALFEYLAKQKHVDIFTVLMQNIKNQLNKAKKPATDPVTKVLECYHDFLDIFSKKNSDKISLHLKYDHKIELLNRSKDHGQIVLRDMSKPQLEFVKKFLAKNLKTNFIKASRALLSLLILLAKKLEDGIRFYIDYWRLDKLTKKDVYFIPLIAKTLAQLKGTKVFSKINI